MGDLTRFMGMEKNEETLVCAAEELLIQSIRRHLLQRGRLEALETLPGRLLHSSKPAAGREGRAEGGAGASHTLFHPVFFCSLSCPSLLFFSSSATASFFNSSDG